MQGLEIASRDQSRNDVTELYLKNLHIFSRSFCQEFGAVHALILEETHDNEPKR